MELNARLIRFVVASSLLVPAGFSSPAAADVITDWNAITLSVAASRPGPTIMLDLATVHLAMHDAVQAYQRRYDTYTPPIKAAAGSAIVAAATAAHDVLRDRFPAHGPALDTMLQDYLTGLGLSTGDAGTYVGQQAAVQVIVKRSTDRSFPATSETFTGGTLIGQWRPTPPGFAPMAVPWLGQVEPFVRLKHRRDLPPPPRLDSDRYARDYEEVKVMGARVNSGRTPEQTDLAYFFSDNIFVQANRAVRAIAAIHLTDTGDTARLLALVNVAAADALMVTWEEKRATYFWRPSTAITMGDEDGNPDTVGDPAWLPLINDPPYPDYPSGLNSLTGAFARTLARFFGTDRMTFDVTSTLPQVAQKTRRYTRFSQFAADAVDARIYLGIHFRFADTLARRIGRQSADDTFTHLLRPLRK